MTFFFQAEDGIRGIGVTGVQTCALPIYGFYDPGRAAAELVGLVEAVVETGLGEGLRQHAVALQVAPRAQVRSEERRVGKECRSRWGPHRLNERSWRRGRAWRAW